MTRPLRWMRVPWCRAASCRGAVVLLASLLPACASLPANLQPPDAERLSLLEVRVTAVPLDVPAHLELANAYRTAGRVDEAIALVGPVLAREANHPEALFQMGLAEEALGRIPEARDVWSAFLAVSPSPRLSRHVRGRVELLGRMEVAAAVRRAVDLEATLGNAEPEPGTLGIFPLVVISNDETLRPLGTAMAVLLNTDMNQTGRLQLLERVQVQAVLDELTLGQTDRVDPTTATRVGRLLSAERIIQGRVEGSPADFLLEAYAVPVTAAAVTGDPARTRGPLGSLFEMQKEIALGLYETMGIQLTAAERERVLQQPTRNLQALLAFGLGVEASDAMRFDAARDHFRDAVRADPDFILAQVELERILDLTEDGGQTLDDLARLAWWEFGPTGIPWRHPRERFVEVDALIPSPTGNPPLEGLGVGLDRRGRVDIVVPRPGGN